MNPRLLLLVSSLITLLPESATENKLLTISAFLKNHGGRFCFVQGSSLGNTELLI